MTSLAILIDIINITLPISSLIINHVQTESGINLSLKYTSNEFKSDSVEAH